METTQREYSKVSGGPTHSSDGLTRLNQISYDPRFLVSFTFLLVSDNFQDAGEAFFKLFILIDWYIHRQTNPPAPPSAAGKSPANLLLLFI